MVFIYRFSFIYNFLYELIKRSLILLTTIILKFLFVSNKENQQNGLLSSLIYITDDEYYSKELNIKKAYNLVSDKKYIYNICIQYADGNTEKLEENLIQIRNDITTFIKSKVLWDREYLQSFLDDIVKNEGFFVCFLAGKSTGKSFIINNLRERNPDKVFVVSLREYPNIIVGLVNVLRKQQLISGLDSKFSLSLQAKQKKKIRYLL